ncbi:Uncharacterised protein [uncultured archaeon]|nr:Uncharacterised protein [uncultured archaeon]
MQSIPRKQAIAACEACAQRQAGECSAWKNLFKASGDIENAPECLIAQISKSESPDNGIQLVEERKASKQRQPITNAHLKKRGNVRFQQKQLKKVRTPVTEISKSCLPIDMRRIPLLKNEKRSRSIDVRSLSQAVLRQHTTKKHFHPAHKENLQNVRFQSVVLVERTHENQSQ